MKQSFAELIAALGEAVPTDLSDLDDEIASLENQIAALRTFRQILALRLGVEAPANGQPRGKRTMPPGSRDGTLIAGRRRKAAEFLAAKGLAIQARIAEAIGCPSGSSLAATLDHEWFVKTPEGYTLAPAARQQFAEAS